MIETIEKVMEKIEAHTCISFHDVSYNDEFEGQYIKFEPGATSNG